jgi:DNA-binding CsgD family transcriptional regulator
VALLERGQEVAAIDEFLTAGGLLVVEGGAGIGKTSLLDAACQRAGGLGYEILRARGSGLESEFAYGVVRQLFEWRLATADRYERACLLEGSAGVLRSWLIGDQVMEMHADDTGFGVLHGLYWLAANLAAGRPLFVGVDDAHWADAPSLRWLAYLAPRLDGLALALMVTLRPSEPASTEAALVAVRSEAGWVSRPGLLSQSAVTAVVREALGEQTGMEFCAALKRLSGGNPFYLRELLRGVDTGAAEVGGLNAAKAAVRGAQGVMLQLADRIRRLDQSAIRLAQALAVLGDGCELRHGAAIAGLDMRTAMRLVAGLVRLEILAGSDPLQFLHPVIRDAVEASMTSDEVDAGHRAAARLLHGDGAPPGRVAAHLVRLQSAGDSWTVLRLQEAAEAALTAGAAQAAVVLLRRALGEPPPPELQVTVLRVLARAEVSAGQESACGWLEEALAKATGRRERAEIGLQMAESCAALFRWVDAVDVIERTLNDLGDTEPELASRLEGELVVAGLHDARRASHVLPTLDRLATRQLSGVDAEAFAVGRGMAAVLSGMPVERAAHPLEDALGGAEQPTVNWDTRAALMWSLVTAERFDAVDVALEPMVSEVERSGSARGLIAVYSTLGLLKLRLGALPEADTAARVALRVLQEGDFAPGLPFAATVLADIAVEAGELEEADAVLGLLPPGGWPAGVATVLIPAARGRVHLAAGRPAEALADFEACASMFSADVWGVDVRDVGYVHARSGAALALLLLGERERARQFARAEVTDVRVFGGHRALGVALRVAGIAEGGTAGLELLEESVSSLRDSPAILERAKSLAELGATHRRAGRRGKARDALVEALDLAARCGARPLTGRVREELKAAGARPRRDWSKGVEALTSTELRVARLAADGRTNRQIAQTLYVTLKTVEGHLARVYTKLGIAGRSELAGALEGEKTRVATR